MDQKVTINWNLNIPPILNAIYSHFIWAFQTQFMDKYLKIHNNETTIDQELETQTTAAKFAFHF
mgnify:CR=1 FL=1